MNLDFHNIRIIFSGTPQFSIPSLEYFYKNFNLVAIITKPDKKQGRGLKIKYSPVKEFALKNRIIFFQPENLNDEEFIAKIKNLNPDFIVDVSYGKIFPLSLLKIPKECCINFHPSLLPGYRGPSPIRWVLINNEKITGVTSHIMSEQIDSGKIIFQKELNISFNEDYGSLYEKLSSISAEIIAPTFENYYKKIFIEKAEDKYNIKNFYARKIEAEEFQINWNKTSVEIYNLIRASSPEPGAFTHYNGIIIKIYEVEIVNKLLSDFKPGQIVDADIKNGIFVKTSDGLIKILKLQRENRKVLYYKDFLNGIKLKPKEFFY
jgi:methionyl-tRNA formyltransferase